MTYRTLTKEELDKILSDHKEWLIDHTKGARADLSCANLRYANLSSANLSSADLRYANLSYANLNYANLSNANLLIFQFNRNVAYFTIDGTMRIGCECMPISEWLIGYKEIGQKHGYSEIEIEVYGDFIRSCAKVFEAKAKEPTK